MSHTLTDIHFTYPSNGQYHQTILFKDSKQLRVFYDRAEEKYPDGGWRRLDKSEINEQFLHPIKRYITPSFEEFSQDPKQKVHIIAVGFDQDSFKGVKTNSVRNPAMVVDISQKKGICLTANLMLHAEKWDFTEFDKRSRLLARYRDESQIPYIYGLFEESGI
ncbi:MAG: hypothetical protein NW224_13190 [Leptolyngbyaceae cyanobacterium bins.302]|nr:hypothetical protein [Leptolyngbyaceae cyanobacterium bins.302]